MQQPDPLLGRHALRLRNRNLDGLGQRYAEFKHDTAADHLIQGGESISHAYRATRILGLVDALAVAAPNRARTDKGKPLNTRLEKAKGVPDIEKLARHIAQSRANVLPRRAWHPPEKKNNINGESAPQIDFLRGLVEDWNVEKSELSNHFPHVKRAVQQAERTLMLYDFVAQLERDFLEVDLPVVPIERNRCVKDLTGRIDEFLTKWPESTHSGKGMVDHLPEDMQARWHKANSGIRHDMMKLPCCLSPERGNPRGDLQRYLDELRYEACSGAYRSLKEISHAYQHDRAAISANRQQLFADPIEQPSRVLQKVYHARWCLLADAIHDLVKSNRPLIENAARKEAASHADTLRQQRQGDARRQGELNL